MEKEFKCPLCESPLTEERFNRIVGVWEAKKKIEEQTKKELAEAKLVKENLIKQTKEIQEKLNKKDKELKKKYEAQFEKEKLTLIKKAQEEAKKLAGKEKIEAERKFKEEKLRLQKEFLAKGKEHEKKRTDKLSKLLEGNIEKLQLANKQIEELKGQLKKGTTPQIEGINLEHELVKELKQKFPKDRIEHHGQGGDILHYVVCEGKEIASIVYECKKTETFSKGYITQIKNDVIKRNANYGVLVTFASDKKHPQFWVDNDILIVHPYGAPYIAEVLRKNLIQIYSLKLSDKDLSERAKKLLNYIKGNKFRNSVKDNILRAKELYDLLHKEIEYHKTIWEKRNEHYNLIAKQSKEIEEDSKQIVGEDLGEEISEQNLSLEMKPRKKKRIVNQFE